LGAVLATGVCVAEEAAQTAPPGDATIATVNGTKYPLELFQVFYLERMQQTQSENVQAFQQQAFNEFMSLIVASQEAERRKLEERSDVAAAMQLQRMKVLSNAAVASMAQEIQPTEEELQKAYEEVKKNAARTEYKARHILVKDEDEAKKLIKELDGGADFAELAKKNSLGPTGKNGGELDWFDANQMVKPFADAVAAMEPGTHSKEPVQTQFGWHVINLQETRNAEPPSFEQAKPQLTAMLQRQQIADKVTDLRNNAMVELNEELVKVTPKDEATEPAEGETEKK
jgi:peptidyl-prolyl cis-trans isomerase C